MSLLAPGCGISWWALAGIGKVESGHGTYGGAEVRADGSLTKPIIGIPLTGSGGTAAIGDSDGGLIDGDPTVDRAAGPMQFIPQTWVAHGVDGDQDGEVRIQDIDDAAASAAAYLCAAAGSMTDVAGLQRGYFSYNHSGEYVASVLGHAIRYGNAVEIEGAPLPPVPPPPPPAPVVPPAGGPPADGATTTAPAPPG
ncbi:lytic transglycosylase domain-containing protein [Iamia sp. SCSIO 61187]|nr:lytic transglycosylase domain-containing protein [Iamia sp. SCSIO 61187]